MSNATSIDASYYDKYAEEIAEVARKGIGPRKVGGRYSGSFGVEYEVVAINPDTRDWMLWSITVRWSDGSEVTHCTDWNETRDRVISEPAEPETCETTGDEVEDCACDDCQETRWIGTWAALEIYRDR